MSGFSAEWLRQREPADSKARWSAAAELISARLPARRAARIVDLGSGTGANCRYLAPRLRVAQHWQLVDHDPALQGLALAACRAAGVVAGIELAQVDLATQLAAIDLAQVDLVTAAALLDLVSAPWFDLLAERCCAVRSNLLFALTYNGRIELAPAHPDDDWLRDLVNRHQSGDKGFGPALGPHATAHAAQRLAALGYRVQTQASDWRLDAGEPALQEQLIAGWGEAAAQLLPQAAARIAGWQQRRLAWVAAGQSRFVVGHDDLLALLPGD